VQEVLSRPEFARHEPSLWDRITGWIAERIGELLELLLGSGRAPGVGTAILVAALLVALGLAVWFARGVRRGTADPIADARVERRRSPSEWLDVAARAEAEGRWRDALRGRYRWLVAELDRRGAVEEADGRTTGEYLAEVRSRQPEAARPFADVTRVFEGAWYGHAAVDRAVIDAFADSAEQVREAVGAGNG
jgi:hypothetical protein